MPRAEVGSTKHLANKMKAKGLQRLRWYCQVCERQMRDENGFKCHTQSESHVRQMMLVGEDPKKFIAQYSNQFQHDFLQLLRTSHGEKKIDANHFYQEYIANKEHIHMNATKWVTLSEFVKMLGRDGICRVEEGERGWMISWIDNSPDALRRQEAIRKKDRQDRGDELREQRAIKEQVERARLEAEANGKLEGEEDEAKRELQKTEGEKIRLEFGVKTSPPAEDAAQKKSEGSVERKETAVAPAPAKVSMKVESKKPKNVFSAMGKKEKKEKSMKDAEPTLKRPMSEAERIMREEMERNKFRANAGAKRQRVA